MNTDEFISISSRFYGKCWQTKLAKVFNYSPQQINRMAHGKTKIPKAIEINLTIANILIPE